MVGSMDLGIGGADRRTKRVSRVSGLAPSKVRGAALGHRGENSKHLKMRFTVDSLNVNTIRGRVCEVVETLSRRNVDVCCVQET